MPTNAPAWEDTIAADFPSWEDTLPEEPFQYEPETPEPLSDEEALRLGMAAQLGAIGHVTNLLSNPAVGLAAERAQQEWDYIKAHPPSLEPIQPGTPSPFEAAPVQPPPMMPSFPPIQGLSLPEQEQAAKEAGRIEPVPIPTEESLVPFLSTAAQYFPEGSTYKIPVLGIDFSTEPAAAMGRLTLGVANYLTSLRGLTEMGVAATPYAPGVMLKWAKDMIEMGYVSAKDLLDAWEKGDTARVAQDINNGIVGLLGGGKLAYHGVKGVAGRGPVGRGAITAGGLQVFPPGVPVEGPTRLGPMRYGTGFVPRGAPAPRVEPAEPLQVVPPEVSAEQARQMQRFATAAFEPAKPERAAVPGGPEAPSDPRVEEIRSQGLKTIREVQDAFGIRDREGARDLLRQAYPPTEEAPPTAPTAPTPVEPPPVIPEGPAAAAEPIPKFEETTAVTQPIAEPPAPIAPPAGVAVAPRPPGAEPAPVLEVPKTKKNLQAQRKQIIRLLEKLEDVDQYGKPFPKEGISLEDEARIGPLRARLADIEQQLLGKKPIEPVTEPPKPVEPAAPSPAIPVEPAKPAAAGETKYGIPIEQYNEMLGYNDAEQKAKWGTTVDELKAAFEKGQKPSVKPAEPAAPTAPEHPLDRLLRSFGMYKGKVTKDGEFETPKMKKQELENFIIAAEKAGWIYTSYSEAKGAKVRSGFFRKAPTTEESRVIELKRRIGRLEMKKELEGLTGDAANEVDAEIARLQAEISGKPAPAPAAPVAPPVAAAPAAPVEAKPAAPAARPEPARPSSFWRARMEKAQKAIENLQKKRAALLEGKGSAADLTQNSRNLDRANAALHKAEGELGLARFREETAQFLGKREPPASKPTITAKTLKTQRDTLLHDVDAALKEAPEEGTDSVTFSIPGDGDWTITNNKTALKSFREIVAKHFPKTVPTVKEPAPLTARAKATPKVTEPTTETAATVAGKFTSEDPSRFVLQTAYADGTQIVATDGRRLIRVVTDQAPGKPDAPVRLKPEGGIDPNAEGSYPNWKAVVDPNPTLLYGGMDTGQLWHVARQAQVFRNTFGDLKYEPFVRVVINPDRSLGADMKIEGDQFSHNVQPGALDIGSYRPDYLVDIATAARELGNEKVDLYAHSGTDGALGINGKNFESLVMPGRIGEGVEVRTDPKKFSVIAGKAEHARLPEGYGPLRNPDDAITTFGTAGKTRYKVTLAADKISLAEIKETAKNRFGIGGHEYEVQHGEFSAKDLGDQSARENVTKLLKPEFDKLGMKVPADHVKEVVKAIGDALKQRREIEKEVEARRAEVAAKPKGPEKTFGFSGGVITAAAPAPASPATAPVPTSATSPQQLYQVQQMKSPSLFGNMTQGLLQLLMPAARSAEHLREAERLAHRIGRMHQRDEAAAVHLRPFKRFFDKLGVHREGIDPADNPGLQFASAMSQGSPLTGRMADAAALANRLFEHYRDLLDSVGSGLNQIRENYFPGMWTLESRKAFNLAMQQAKANGVIPADLDVNNATPQQRAAIKALVDQNIEQGVGSDKDALSYLTRRPFAGRESFRKEKVFDDIMDAAQFGLRPVSYNPIDLIQLKLAEMSRSIMAHEHFAELKEHGLLKIVNPYQEIPEGWSKLPDRYGTIYGRPTIEEREYVDKMVYDGLMRVAKGLGIKPERVMRAGRGRLGYASTSGKTVTQFATELSVLAHELGHQLDFKYDLWNRIVKSAQGIGAKGTVTKTASQQMRGKIQVELRNLADLSFEGSAPNSVSAYYKQRVRAQAEKMAHMLEAYIHARDKFQTTAPTVFKAFDDFIKSKPELKELADVKPGISLEKLTNERYVGLPIMGYRIVPQAAADILNNYLSTSLYNSRYFGALYRGWMAIANALNQTQLGMGSMFHGGFTTAEAQISSNANLLKDFYGVLRGNRSVGDLMRTAGKSTIASIHTSIVGDRVLNAWRDNSARIDPRIAQVVEAAEVAGAGFRIEKGLTTDNVEKMMREWYSGERLKAAARSPRAFVELLAKPIMEFLVPRQKAGVFADLVWRIIEQNPGKSMEELRPEIRQAWNRVDARLGQVRYDRLFMDNITKNLIQATVRAPGWSGGTLAEIGGGFGDVGRFFLEWKQTGRMPENLPDRTAYVMSLMTTVMGINAALTYAFTGQQPKGLDFFAFRSGGKDEQGRDERFMIPSYVKDLVAYFKHPGETLMAKAHPLSSVFTDLIRNKDYYGVEIRSRGESIPTQIGESAAYVIKSFEPFWTRGTRRERARGGGYFKQFAPLIGVMPAPRSLTETKAERTAHDRMLEQIPVGARTKGQAERARLRSEKGRKLGHYLERTVKRLSAPNAVDTFEDADAAEQRRIYYEVKAKIDNATSLSDAEKTRLRQRMKAARRY